jgi:hypothetical protein
MRSPSSIPPRSPTSERPISSGSWATRGSSGARQSRRRSTTPNLELDAEHTGFGRYLSSHGGFEETVAYLKRQFRFIGDSGAYHFL